MAREIGISPTTVCKIANGSIPDMTTLRKVSAWLGTCCEDYVGIKQAPSLVMLPTELTLASHIMFANENWIKSGIKSVSHE